MFFLRSANQLACTSCTRPTRPRTFNWLKQEEMYIIYGMISSWYYCFLAQVHLAQHPQVLCDNFAVQTVAKRLSDVRVVHGQCIRVSAELVCRQDMSYYRCFRCSPC